jgi:hypothetical protein
LTLIFPFWPSAPWWHHLLAPGEPTHLSSFVHELRELPPAHDLFLPGSTGNARPRRAAPWRIFAARVDFTRPAPRCLPSPH